MTVYKIIIYKRFHARLNAVECMTADITFIPVSLEKFWFFMTKPPNFSQQQVLPSDDLDQTYIPCHSCLECVYAQIALPTTNFKGICTKYNYVIRGPFPVCDAIKEHALAYCDKCGDDYYMDEDYCPRCGHPNTPKGITHRKFPIWTLTIPTLILCIWFPWLVVLTPIFILLGQDNTTIKNW
jgi:ribosomal protein L37E